MKRFFTFLMAVWALLSISQTVKAVDFCIMGTFDGGNRDTWTKLGGQSMHSDGNNQYSQTYQCTKAGEYRFRFIGDGWDAEMCPYQSSYDLTKASPNYKVYYTNQDGRQDNYFYVNMESGKTYTFTFDNSSKDNRTVACTVSGEGSGTVTPIEKYCSFYLIGNLHSDSEWQDGTRANLFTTFDGKTYTYTFTGVGKTVYFRVQGYDSDGNKFEKDLAPDNTEDKPLSTNFETVVYKPYNSSKAWHFDAKSDKTYTITLNYSDTSKPQIKYSEQGSGTVTKENPIANRKYSEGYYLVGNFFNFDGDNINYDDAVFKFQQQKDDDEGNAVYMVEIPATLTAKAQVMSVGVTGTADAIYGPGSVLAINNSTLPVGTDNPTATTGIKNLKSSTKIEDDGTNRWDMTTRRTESDGVGQDGSYKYYITVDKTTGKPSKWEIKYTDLKRVAYFISTDKSASALTIGSIRVNSTSNFGSGKYFGSLYIDKGGEYYAISNDLRANEVIDKGYSYGYGAIKNQIDRPTYNKLFLFGNNGVDATTGTDDAKLAANKGTFKMPSITGVYVLEFNSNKGNNSVEGNYGGTGAEIIKRSDRNVISSLSMVGPAIPGTTTGNEWDWASTVADMDFDVSENCYKLTIATTEENKNQVFRFVGNHTQEINWFENGTEAADKAASYPYGDVPVGHKASLSDPNEVSYTQNGLSEEDKSNDDNLNILWNRPAGTWTVRFHIYTYSQNGNDPSYRYFYTISENRDLELRDFGDVVYKSETRNILNRGDYRYFRTWSDNKAWKRPENVDVFVVSKVTPADETHNVGFELKKINGFNSSEDVIPANTGVILALKENAKVPGAVFHKRKSLITYNTLVIPLEEATNKELSYDGEGKTNLLVKMVDAGVVPTYNTEKKEYNYLFGFFRANKGLGVTTYEDNDFLLGFWLSKGAGLFYSNSAYLPVSEATAAKMNLGVSYDDFDHTTGAKKVPALLFDFANVGGTTGINEVVNQSTKLNDGKYYTLSGQQVEKPTAGGIYIHNGRKFVVK